MANVDYYELADEIGEQRRRCLAILEEAKQKNFDRVTEAAEAAQTATHNAQHIRTWCIGAPNDLIRRVLGDADDADTAAQEASDLREAYVNGVDEEE